MEARVHFTPFCESMVPSVRKVAEMYQRACIGLEHMKLEAEKRNAAKEQEAKQGLFRIFIIMLVVVIGFRTLGVLMGADGRPIITDLFVIGILAVCMNVHHRRSMHAMRKQLASEPVNINVSPAQLFTDFTAPRTPAEEKIARDPRLRFIAQAHWLRTAYLIQEPHWLSYVEAITSRYLKSHDAYEGDQRTAQLLHDEVADLFRIAALMVAFGMYEDGVKPVVYGLALPVRQLTNARGLLVQWKCDERAVACARQLGLL